MTVDALANARTRVGAFKRASADLLGRHEGSSSRVISLVETWRKLSGLSLRQHEEFREALLALEQGLYKAAHVLGWLAFMDFLEEKLASDRLQKVRSVRAGWARYTSVEDLRENVPEFQLLEVARDVKLLSKSESKTLQGLLAKRNECGHPSSYVPGLNETLGYLSELLNRVGAIDSRPL